MRKINLTTGKVNEVVADFHSENGENLEGTNEN